MFKKLMEKVGGNYAMCRIPGMVLTEEKALLAYYECRKGDTSDWDDIDIRIIRSTDGGESWETVHVIGSDGATLNNPVMIANGNTLHFLYCKNYRQIYHAVSRDGGRNFSEAREITEVADEIGCPFTVVAIGPGHGICHNGRLLAPVWYAYDPNDLQAHHPSFIATVYSDDNGESWHMGEIIGRDTLVDPSECALAVTAEGDVMISIRNECPEMMRALAFSKTGIDGWSKPTLTPTLPDPVCQGSMDHANGLIYHVNCDCGIQRVRTNLTVKISRDNFATFDPIRIDDEGGYADIAVDGDTVYVLYERAVCRMGREIERDGIYFVRFSAEQEKQK